MGQNKELDQQIWDFIYDLLPEDAAKALHARITSEPDVARAYARAKLQSELIAEAARCRESPMELRIPEEDIVSPPVALPRRTGRLSRSVRTASWFVGVAATVLICVIGSGFLRTLSPWMFARQGLAERAICTRLVAPDGIHPRAPTLFTVRTTALDGTPRSARVAVRFVDSRGWVKKVQSRTTDAAGGLQVSLPASSATAVTAVEVEAEGNPPSTKVRAELTPLKSELITHVSLNKSQYSPGETLYFRSVTLSRFDLDVDREATVEYDVRDPAGSRVFPVSQQGVTQRGVGNGAYPLPSQMSDGVYSLVASSPQGEFPEARQRFLVQSARPSPARAAGRMAKQTLERGMDVRRVPESRPLGALAESEARNQRGKSGSEFRAEFGKADEVVSAGRAGMQEQTGEKRGGLAVHASFYPEGGELVAGLPSRVYFHCRDAIGKPVDVVGRLVDQDGDVVAEARTAQAGRGFFELTPTGGQSYSLRIGEPQGASDPPERLAVSDGRTIVLHVEKTCLAADDPLSLRICSIRGDAQLVVAVYCRGVIVGQQLADRSQFVRGTSNWECQFAVPLTSEADGLLRVTALDVDRSPPETVAERLVYRRPRKKLDVHIENLDEVASADGKVQLRVMTTDETSAPVPAVLSVGVVDNTVSQLDPASQTQLPAFAYLANEIRDAEELENANFFLSEEARAELALDLLLGTQDWRRFMDTTLQALAQSANPSRHGQRTLALGEALDVIVRKEGRESQESPSRRAGLPTEIAPIDVVPVVYDNTAQVERSVAEAELAEQAAHAAARRRLGQVLCLGGSALAIAVMLLLVARVSLAARAWAPALTAAGVSLFVGVYWWEGGFHVGSQVALRPKTEAARATPSEPVRKLEEAERLADRASYGAPAPLAPEAATSVPPPAAAAVPSAAVDDASPGNRDSLDYRSYGAGSLAARSDPQQPAVEQFGAAMERGVQPAPGLQRRATAEGQTAGVGVRPAASPPAPVAANERSQERMGREGKAMLDLRPQDPAAMEAAKPFSVGAGAGGFSGGGAYVPFPQKGVAPSAGATLSVGKHPVATGFPIRQFAFQRDRKDEPANQVSGTLYWSPIVNTGKDGRATIEFDLSEAPPGIRLLIDGHAPGRLGSMDQVVVPRPAAAARQQ